MKTGKLEIQFLKRLLNKYTILDSQVVVGPKIGEDAAVLSLGKGFEHYWVLTSDPITFTTEEMGYYGVVVNMNDIATRGAIPKWFWVTLLFPEKVKPKEIEKIFYQIHQTCKRFNISFVGGHTEITPGLDKPILSGYMVGEVKRDRLVTTGGARRGDLILLAKGICIEGTSIIAREKESELLKKGISPSIIKRAKDFIFNPGIDVLLPARIACNSSPIHSMHDPTEGGLINGLIEMAWASEKEIEVDLNKIFIYNESRILCSALGLNPFGVIASGALLLTLSPQDLMKIERAFKKVSIPFQVIGKIKKGPGRVLVREGKFLRELNPLPRDEILKIYD